MAPFRILALDGGGIRGTFTAAVLDEIQLQLKHPIADYFDLIVGTSTGGIIALGLGCDIPTSRILDLYKSEGNRVFAPASSGWTGWIDRMFQPEFTDFGLRQCLSEIFTRNRKFIDIPRSIAVTSFDAATAHPVVFKTKYHPSLNGYGDLTVVEVGLATSAAPTFFPAAQGVMLDGGVWANCPVMVGIVDALTLFGKTPEEIRLLSVGTTTNPMFVSQEALNGGVFHWIKTAPGVLMHATKLAAIEQAKKLCHTFERLDEVVPTQQIDGLANLAAVAALERRGRGEALRRFQDLKTPFFHRRVDSDD